MRKDKLLKTDCYYILCCGGSVEGSGEVEQSEGEVEVNLQDGEGQREDGSVWMKFEEFRKAFS